MSTTGRTTVRRWLWIGLAVAVVIAGVFIGPSLFAPQGDPSEQVSDDEPEVDVRPRLTATRVVGRRQGERQFELDAGSIGDDGDWVVLERIRNGLLYRDGEVFVTFQSEAGRWHRPTNNLILTGEVILRYDDRVDIETDELQWIAKDEMVVSEKPVRLLIDGDEVTALTMEADLDEERVHLEGDVRIVRESGDRMAFGRVVYLLAEDRLEGFGRGQLVFGADDGP